MVERREEGFTFIELMFSVGLIVIASVVLISHLAVNYSFTRSQQDQVFANMAASSILAEVHSLTEADAGVATFDVDTLGDGATFVPSLTLSKQSGVLLAPDHEISGNILRNGQWVWSRQISVGPLPGVDNRKLRYVTVKIFKTEGNGNRHEVASLSSVVNSMAAGFPATQVFDIYFLAVENIPGWWVYMESIRPFMEAMVTDLESNNPGLEIRTHWITKSAYGRDQLYRPYVNETTDSEQPFPYVYFYPGLMPTGNSSTYYYVPGLMRGHFVNETGEQNGYDANLNPYPYAMADRFNHAMRYPRARAFQDLRVNAIRARKQAITAAIAGGLPVPPEFTDMSEETTLRLLLEEMQSDPAKHKHALLVNLHGELLPMPAMRNLSDPARDPVGLPGMRVVTHPEELRTDRPPSLGAADVRLRVYAYLEEPEKYPTTDKMPVNRPIAIQVMDVDLTDGVGGLHTGVQIENLRGGIVVNGDANYYALAASKSAADAPATDEMYYDASFIDPGAGQQKFTLLRLYNTPLRTPAIVDGTVIAPGTPVTSYPAPDLTGGSGPVRGLFPNLRSRLYNLEYVPAPTEALLDFSRDLSSTGDGPKNSARWVITIPSSIFVDARWVDTASPPNYFDPTTLVEPDRLLAVRTRIWDPAPTDTLGNAAGSLETGTVPGGTESRYVQPANFSETYTWWADSRDDVPFTERSQFLGDPRLNPYKDLLSGDPDFGDGYNWYFDSLDSGVDDARPDFPGLDGARLFDLWDGEARFDAPRYWQQWRRALVNSGVIFTTLNGWSFYYAGFGGEVGYDSTNGYPNSIPIDLGVMGTPGVDGYMQTLAGSWDDPRSNEPSYWWARPWAGELCPDDQYGAQWLGVDGSGAVRGNLDVGTSLGSFYRDTDQVLYSGSARLSFATDLSPAESRVKGKADSSFMNAGTSTSHFSHLGSTATSSLVGSGLEIGTNYNMAIPTTVTTNRPYDLASSSTVGSDFDLAPYAMLRHQIPLVERYFDFPTAGQESSALLELRNGASTDAAYIAVNGISQTSSVSSTILAKYALLALVHSYFVAGDPLRTFRVPMTPRVEIAQPTEITELLNPTSIDVKFDVSWVRWDGIPYTGTTPVGFSEAEADLDYRLLYSKNEGVTWFHMQDDTQTEVGIGVAPGAPAEADALAGQESYAWATPMGSFPQGNYLIRVEAYRRDQNLHYAHHTKRIYIER